MKTTDLYLKVSGGDYKTGLSFEKTEIISQFDLDEMKSLIGHILHNKEHYNWTWDTTLVPKGDDWVDEYNIFKMYPVRDSIIKKFMKYVPRGIDSIRNVEVFRMEKVNIEF